MQMSADCNPQLETPNPNPNPNPEIAIHSWKHLKSSAMGFKPT